MNAHQSAGERAVEEVSEEVGAPSAKVSSARFEKKKKNGKILKKNGTGETSRKRLTKKEKEESVLARNPSHFQERELEAATMTQLANDRAFISTVSLAEFLSDASLPPALFKTV